MIPSYQPLRHAETIHSPEGRYERRGLRTPRVLDCGHPSTPTDTFWARVAGSGHTPATMCQDCMEAWFGVMRDADRLLPLLRLAYDDDWHYTHRKTCG